jgi:16S rRNA (cytosine1402-N4)-methyltransferase
MKIYDVEHYPVFHRELLQYLPPDCRCILDGTFGHGGLADYILSSSERIEKYYALDRDPAVIEYFQREGLTDSRIELFHADFSDSFSLPPALRKTGFACAVILDLGCSQYQLKEAGRGFSFLHDGPLDMRMNTSGGRTLKEWLQKAREEEIYRVLREFGEERYAGRIARRIFEHRHELQTTLELAGLISRSVPSRGGWQRIHPATRSFQAFRILLNQELDSLESALNGLLPCLRSGGRLMVVSFHSLEDRIIKQCFRGWEDGAGIDSPVGRRVNKKVIFPSPAELSENPPSRSAKLRIFEKF